MTKEAWQNLTAAYFGPEAASGGTFVYDEADPHPLLSADRFETSPFKASGRDPKPRPKPRMDVNIEVGNCKYTVFTGVGDTGLTLVSDDTAGIFVGTVRETVLETSAGTHCLTDFACPAMTRRSLGSGIFHGIFSKLGKGRSHGL